MSDTKKPIEEIYKIQKVLAKARGIKLPEYNVWLENSQAYYDNWDAKALETLLIPD